MNWKESKEKYPKAMDILYNTLSIDDEYTSETFGVRTRWDQFYTDYLQPCEGIGLDDRYLYDFFDENEIWIDIDHEFGTDWTFTIDNGGNGHDGDGTIYKTRTEAETAAFTKAFEIFEEKLK